MTLIFNTRNRIGGPGGANCAGCGQQVTLMWNNLILESINESPINVFGKDKGECVVTINDNPTPAINRTWGSLKSLYR